MGLFNNIGGMLGLGDAPQFNPQTVQLNQGMLGNVQGDIQNVRGLATSPITGLSAAGEAGQDFANQAYQNQLDQFNRQAGSNLATTMAGIGRFGGDSGAAERMSAQNMRQQLVGQQGLAATNLQNQAQGAFQDLGQQQSNQFTALMGLPQMSMNPLQLQANIDSGNVGISNQAALANMAGDAANSQKFGDILGTVGGIAGTALGGPVGSAIGGIGGRVLGGLFS